jgi:hypothetical protein
LRFCSTHVLPLGTILEGQSHPVPLRLSVAGARHLIGSTHVPPRGTSPARQTHSVPAALGMSGERQTSGLYGVTHCPSTSVVGGGHMQIPSSLATCGGGHFDGVTHLPSTSVVPC